MFSFAGALVAGAVAIRLSRYLIRDDRVYAFAIAVLLGGLLTARLGHIADNLEAYLAAPDRFVAFWGGGIAVTAAPIGSTVAGVIAARRLRLPGGFMLDVAAIGIVVGLAVGRVGDVINGEHHAVACHGLAWCVRYIHPETLGQSTFVHPVVLYDALWDLVLAGLGYAHWRRSRGRAPEGRTYLLILGLYGAGRALSSALRLDPVVLLGLQEAQILGAIYAALALPAFALAEMRARRSPLVAERPGVR